MVTNYLSREILPLVATVAGIAFLSWFFLEELHNSFLITIVERMIGLLARGIVP